MGKLYDKSAKKAICCLLFLGTIFFLIGEVFAKVPDDPEYAKQESMWNQINAPAAWDYSTGSSKVVVAVIDSGADTWHDDLHNNVWINYKEIPDNDVDDDRNGFVDDVHGWNFVEYNNNVRPSVFESSEDTEAVRHGTIIAGLVGAQGDNDRNGVGVNWHVSIMPIRAIDSSGSGSIENVARAVEYAVDNGASIVSMSFVGTVFDEDLRQVLRQAYEKGVVIVVAAGNNQQLHKGDLDNNPVYPACFDSLDDNWILTVGSVDSKDVLSFFTNYGSCVDVMAPGEELYSIERYAPQYGYLKEFGGGWRGTSFSTPLIAGTAALIKALHPEWKAKEIISTILNNTDSLDEQNPYYRGKLGRGRLNIGKAVAYAASIPKLEPQISSSLYVVKEKKIWRVDYGEHPEPQQISLIEADEVDGVVPYIRDVNQQVLAVLLRREKYYFIRLMDNQGNFIKEFPLNFTDNQGFLLRRLKVLNGEMYSDHFLVERYLPGKNSTEFLEFDDEGSVVKTLSVPGVVKSWDTDSQMDIIILAQMKRNKVILKQISWQNETINTKTILKINKVIDISIDRPGEITLLAHYKGSVNRLAIDMEKGIVKQNNLGPISLRVPWKLWALPSGNNSVLYAVENKAFLMAKDMAVTKVSAW